MSKHRYIGDVDVLAAAFRGLSDPYRLRVFITLLQMSWDDGGDPGCAGDMADVVDEVSYSANVAPSLAEHHLMELKRAGLVHITEGSNGRLMVSVNLEMLARASRVVGEKGVNGGDQEG